MLFTIFKKENLNIVLNQSRNLILRAARIDDIELLRVWKNKEKEFFFHQSIIDSEMQKKWFDGYLTREFDIMTIVELNGMPIGCMAIRYKEKNWDVYNVILGIKEFGGKGDMGVAFRSLLEIGYSLKPLPIKLQVLSQNPAVSWYHKHGFVILEKHDTYFTMVHKLN